MSSYITVVSLIFGLILGQFGYGAGVLLILLGVTLWAGGALHVWINVGGASFIITTSLMTGLITIGTHFAITFFRKYIRPRPTD